MAEQIPKEEEIYKGQLPVLNFACVLVLIWLTQNMFLPEFSNRASSQALCIGYD